MVYVGEEDRETKRKDSVKMEKGEDEQKQKDVHKIYFAGFRSTGRSHAKGKMPCQDSFSIGKTKDGSLIIAVADGVSNSSHSEKASNIATAAAVEFWQEFHTSYPNDKSWESALFTSMNYALRKIDEQREVREEAEAFSFETTLMVAIISPGNEMRYVFVGDGGMYLLSDEGTVTLLEDPMRAEEGSVYTLSGGPNCWRSGMVDLSKIRAVLMVTDGISDVIRKSETDYSLAKKFIQRVNSFTEYAEICETILAESCFKDMDDDACVVMYQVDQYQSEENKIIEESKEEIAAWTDLMKAFTKAVHSSETVKIQTVLPWYNRKHNGDKKEEQSVMRLESILQTALKKKLKKEEHRNAD